MKTAYATGWTDKKAVDSEADPPHQAAGTSLTPQMGIALSRSLALISPELGWSFLQIAQI
jgi:hypothetical protein